MFNYFYISLFAYVCACLCLCIFLLVFVCVCVCVLPVTSLLFAFVLYLLWLCFSKTIRLTTAFIPLKIPAKGKKVCWAFFL